MVTTMTPPRDLAVESAARAPVENAEIEKLLQCAYVEAGFTDPDQASAMFAARSVRERGDLLIVRDPETTALLGMVVVVPASSPGKRLALPDEAEMQLLAVSPEHQGQGIGRLLVGAATAAASRLGYTKMVLWTQPTMLAAQHLYATSGFVRAPKRDFQRGDGRSFLVFTLEL